MKNVVFRALIIGIIGLLIGFGAFFIVSIVRYEATLYLEPTERMEQVSVLIKEGIVSSNTGEFDIGATFAKSAVIGGVVGVIVFGIAMLICTTKYKRSNKAAVAVAKPIQPFGTQKSVAENANSNQSNPFSASEMEELKQRLEAAERHLTHLQKEHDSAAFDAFKTEEIDYNCTHYFINGFVISSVITFFVFVFLCAIIEFAPIVQVFYWAIELAVSVGVSVGVYCIIYAIYKGSKEQINRLQYQSQKIIQQHQERIFMLEREIANLSSTDCGKDPRDRGDS